MTYQSSPRHIENAKAALKIWATTKLECSYCGEIKSANGMRNHLKSCFNNPDNIAFCPVCDKRIHNKKQKFCSKSCGAIKNNTGRKITKFFTCLGCSEEKIKGKNSLGKFCNNVCQGVYRWEQTKVRILKGDIVNIGVGSFRRFLIERDGHKCSECGINPEWNGTPLTLDVDHRDGNHYNNDPLNLRFLCPNCHTQTPTWGAKKRL